MKRTETLLKELRKELHYWQGIVRLDASSLRRSRAKAMEVAKKMRKLQKNGTYDERDVA